MTARHFPVLVEQDEDGVFIVECPVFDRCRSYGHSLDEPVANMREAIELCLVESGREDAETVFLGVRDIELVI